MRRKHKPNLSIKKLLLGFLNDYRTYIFLTAYSFVLLLFSTSSSPLFAFSPGVDTHAYFTMGKGLFNGFVPYVDLIDHKGPLTFLLFGIAWLMDNTGWFGVYVLQSIFLAVSSIYIYRLAEFFIKKHELCVLTAMLFPLPLISRANWNVSVEEFVLGFFVVALYYFAVYFLKPEAHKIKHVLILGVLFGSVFLIKFNLSAFFGGFILVIAYNLIKNKDYKALGRYIAWFTAGVLIIFLPYLLYALITSSLEAFIYVYFVINNQYSGTADSPMGIRLIIAAVSNAVRAFDARLVFVLFSLVGIVYTFIKTKSEFVVGYCLSLVLLMVAIYVGRTFGYSCIPINIFLIFGIIALCALLEKYFDQITLNAAGKCTAVLMVMLIIIGRGGFVRNPLFMSQFVPLQIQMAELIWANARDDSPTLLQVASLDSGFYTTSGIIPREPHFYVPNIAHDIFPTIRDGQRDAVREGRHEFVIVHTDAYANLPDENHWWLGRHYTRITALHGDSWFHLYQRILFPESVFNDNVWHNIVNTESNINENFYRLNDGNDGTFWDTGRPPQAGDYIQFEFRDAVAYNYIFLDQGSRMMDFPRSLSFFISQNGDAWHEVPHNALGWNYFHLQQETYQFLRIVNNGSDATNCWSINNIRFGNTAEIRQSPFAAFLEGAFNENNIIVMSVRDEASRGLNAETQGLLHSIGLNESLIDRFRYSYAAIIDGRSVIFEQLSNEEVRHERVINNSLIELLSAGFAAGNTSSILVNGVEHSRNRRGINIVVINRNTGNLVDSISFDTFNEQNVRLGILQR